MTAFWITKRRKVGRAATTSSTSHHGSHTPTPHDSAVAFTITSPPQTTVPLQPSPIYTLPVELIQYITSFLPGPCASSFCLTGRYICYAIGRQQLHAYLRSDPSKVGKRKNIEIIERAFPSHWYCPWCDRFHQHDKESGPKSVRKETRRDCAEFNSYLHAGKNYVLRFHHIRLAVNRASWGEDYGIPIEDFGYRKAAELRLGKKKLQTTVEIEAKIVSGRFFVHSMFTIIVPRAELQRKKFEEVLYEALPQIVVGHRENREGHTGLRSAVKQALKKYTYQASELCYTCATDWIVHRQIQSPDNVPVTQEVASTSPVLLKIESWRDLGNGRNPFCTSWRAHGEIGKLTPGFGGDIMRLTTFAKGDIRRSFEKGYDIKLPFRYGLAADPKLMKAWEEMLREDWRKDIVTAGGKYSRDVTDELERREAQRMEVEWERREVERREAEGGVGVGGLVGWQAREINQRFRVAGCDSMGSSSMGSGSL